MLHMIYTVFYELVSSTFKSESLTACLNVPKHNLTVMFKSNAGKLRMSEFNISAIS